MAGLGKRFKSEQMVNLLREIEVMMANGKTLLEACKQAGISDKSYIQDQEQEGEVSDYRKVQQYTEDRQPVP